MTTEDTTERRGRREVEQPKVGPDGARLAGASESKDTEAAAPETDAAVRMAFAQEYMVPTEFAKQLERERDEAREAIIGWENKWKCAVDMAARAELERDEAIADRDIARLAALESDKAHDRMVGELEKVYKERDELLAYLDAEHYATCNLELREKLDEAIELLRKALEARK